MIPRQSRMVLDVELTNRCNATCDFCPRDNMPQMGHMSKDDFKTIVHRILEAGENYSMSVCGTGEPSIHPDFAELVTYAAQSGVSTQLTTNASRLTREISRKLIDAGLRKINFSLTGLDAVYERIYGLGFESVKRNVLDFIDEANGRCEININLVDYEKFSGDVDINAIKNYWKALGVKSFYVMKVSNRGGALGIGVYEPDKYKVAKESNRDMMQQYSLKGLCEIAFATYHIGWDGQYYLCCHDWKHQVPFGHVSEYSISEIYERKRDYFANENIICHRCVHYPLNVIRQTGEIVHEKVRYTGDDLIKLLRESEGRI